MISNYNLSQGENKRFVSNQGDRHYDLFVFDSDLMMSCPDRICAECGVDHSFEVILQMWQRALIFSQHYFQRILKEIPNQRCS